MSISYLLSVAFLFFLLATAYVIVDHITFLVLTVFSFTTLKKHSFIT